MEISNETNVIEFGNGIVIFGYPSISLTVDVSNGTIISRKLSEDQSNYIINFIDTRGFGKKKIRIITPNSDICIEYKTTIKNALTYLLPNCLVELITNYTLATWFANVV